MSRFLIFGLLLASLDTPAQSEGKIIIGKTMNAGECSAAHGPSDKSNFEFVYFKKVLARDKHQPLPKFAKDSVKCTAELKRSLGITSEHCEIMCNPE